MIERIRLLTLLAGCPDGVTQYSLMVNHGFPPGVVYDCVQCGLIDVWTETVTRGDRLVTVFHFYVTEAGRAEL
jgi:hypothetical protein